MKQYELTGGARIGMANATFPFAKLKVNKEKLEINATIIGNLVFTTKDIISIEPYQQIPIIGKGLKINHRVPDYKEKVIFWTFKNPEIIIEEIRKTGFFENTNSDISQDDIQIQQRQKQGGFPVKKPFAIGAIIIWNILIAYDLFNFLKNPNPKTIHGLGVKAAIGFLLGTAVLTLLSKPFRSLILKKGRELDDVKTFLYFIIFICSFFILNFALMANIK